MDDRFKKTVVKIVIEEKKWRLFWISHLEQRVLTVKRRASILKVPGKTMRLVVTVLNRTLMNIDIDERREHAEPAATCNCKAVNQPSRTPENLILHRLHHRHPPLLPPRLLLLLFLLLPNHIPLFLYLSSSSLPPPLLFLLLLLFSSSSSSSSFSLLFHPLLFLIL